MVFFNQTLNRFFAFLLIFVAFLLSYSSSPASCNELHPKINSTDSSDSQPAAAYQVLRIKNTTPFFLNKPERGFEKKRKRKRKMTKRRKINMDSNFKTRPFTVMLPKGFVPPSSSSPCHNDKPDSAVAQDLICGLSGTAAKP
ncbi:hypothetical protein V6N13_119877 [Hibiscus sabdariffa]|uniref:Uncharacterized protein n=1 Tax=Hibiscus sabdariffa TaxID=183260 RepID=A0ABR2E4A6_9ROSI